MAKTCGLCGDRFAIKVVVDGKLRNFQRRKYCLKCSPFGSGNTRKLDGSKRKRLPLKERKRREADKYRRYQRKARRERKRKLVEMLGGKCSACGYDKCIGAMDFHHPDTNTKEFGISHAGLLTKWDDLVKEVRKCKLLCRNCHAELHWDDTLIGRATD